MFSQCKDIMMSRACDHFNMPEYNTHKIVRDDVMCKTTVSTCIKAMPFNDLVSFVEKLESLQLLAGGTCTCITTMHVIRSFL